MPSFPIAPKRLLAFHVMAKPTGPICNLDCKYCFYLEKEGLYPGKAPGTAGWAMPEPVLDAYIRQYLAARTAPSVTFTWQGGEPTLLGLDYFRRVVELQQKYADGRPITNTIQTNGVLLDDAWARFFHDHRFLVGISIDGPRELHDRYRVNKGGQPTFDAVMRGITLLKKHAVEFNTLTVVHRGNARHPLELYRFLREIGSGFLQFIPVVERIAPSPGPDGLHRVGPRFQGSAAVSEWSVEPAQYGEFLCVIFDEWVHCDVGRTFVQMFDVALESWYGIPQGICVFRETCGAALALEHNGDLYSCDHYVYPEHKLGNILDVPLEKLVTSPAQRRFGMDKRSSLPKYCRECDVRFACNGECPKHRFLETPDGEPGLNYLCAAYKRFFHHVAPYMEFMATELQHRRAPKNVMQWRPPAQVTPPA